MATDTSGYGDGRAPGSRRAHGIDWTDTVLAAVATVSWALVAMAGTAALGLHLLGADAAGALGPMTAAVVVLGAGGRVTPSGDMSVFGLDGAQAHTAIDMTPLGVSLAGALVLAHFFLRSLRGGRPVVPLTELLVRAGSVAALFIAVIGWLAWAGHDQVTIDGSSLGIDPLPAGELPGGAGDVLPGGLGDLGDLGGLLPDRLADLARAQGHIGFSVDTWASLAGGACWVVGVLLIALLAARRVPLPPGLARLHGTVRPAVSALVAALLVAVLAGWAAAGYAAVGDAHPRRIAGAALLGAPNGTWLGIPLGLFVPWHGRATGELAKVLPDPLDELLRVSAGEPVTLGRLAGLDGRIWLLAVAAALLMLYAGALAASRTPLPGGGGRPGDGGLSAGRFAGRCALRLGVVTAFALPLLVRLTRVSADASLSVLGFDAFGAGIELHGHLGAALLLGAVWGAAAGGAGALLAYWTGAAGRYAPVGGVRGAGAGGYPGAEGTPGPYTPSRPYRPSHDDTNPYLRPAGGVHSAPTMAGPGPIGPPAPPPPGPGPGRPASGEPPTGRSRPDGPPPPGGPAEAPPVRPQTHPPDRPHSGPYHPG